MSNGEPLNMNKRELLFYDAYEAFYTMAKESNAFQSFCKDAFDADFSQDGFSNKEQVDMILQYIPRNEDVHILEKTLLTLIQANDTFQKTQKDAFLRLSSRTPYHEKTKRHPAAA